MRFSHQVAERGITASDSEAIMLNCRLPRAANTPRSCTSTKVQLTTIFYYANLIV